MFNPPLVIGSQVIVPQTIYFFINDLFQGTLELNPLSRINYAFKNRILNALSVIGTGLGNLPEPFLATGTGYHHIVTHKNHHRYLPPKERGIPVNITSNISGHEIRLNKKEKANGNLFLNIGMVYLILLTALILGQNRFSGLIVHGYRTVGCLGKPFLP